MVTGPELRPSRTFSFGPFELSEGDVQLLKDGNRIKLQEQPYQVLAELLANAGRVVTREELQQRLWPADTFVDFDVGLNSAVRKLRQALGDDADRPRYIETLSKRGYRFIAPVKEEYEGVSPESGRPAPTLVVRETVPSPPAAIAIEPQKHAQKYVFAGISALIFAALGYLALHNSSSAIPRLLTEQRITSNPEEAPIRGAVMSPDGKYLAYADPTGAYFRNIDTGETHALPTPKGKGEEWVPTSWYPDSTHVLLSSRPLLDGAERYAQNKEDADIWRSSILGGPPQKIAESAGSGTVSPDGSHIAFLRGQDYGHRQIWIADTRGDSPKQLLVSGSSEDVISELSWSPSGDHIAYIRVYREERELWAIETLDVRTHAKKTLKIAARLAPALSWAPDGRLLYGYQPDESGERIVYALYAIRVNEKTGEVEGRESELTKGLGIIDSISVSADGKRLVLWRNNAAAESFVSEIDPVTQNLRPPQRITLDQNKNFVTAWTPDSRAILFSSNRSGAYRLYRQDIDNTVPELLVDSERIRMARIAPDGNHIIVVRETDLAHREPFSVMQVPIEGGSPRLLFQDLSLVDVQCPRVPGSPCLYLTASPESGIYSFDPNDGKKQKLGLTYDPDIQEWGLSPDGTTIALLLSGAKLEFVNTVSGEVHELQVPGWSSLLAVDWAPDSKSVYVFSRKQDGNYVLLRIQPDGTTRAVLESGKVPRYQWAIPSPDGRHVALKGITGENNVWMVERF